VLPDEQPREFNDSIPLIGFLGETASLQVAVLPPYLADTVRIEPLQVRLRTPEGVRGRISTVELVPVSLPAFEDADEHYLRTAPTLLPDLLRPADDGMLTPVPGQWRAAWIDIDVSDDATPGDHFVEVDIRSTTLGSIQRWTVPMHIPRSRLPELDIPHVEWFHTDGIADYYGYEVFSEDHWAAIDAFLASAERAHVNAILTPVWTPPLDTQQGGTRTPTQLVDIRDRGDERYEFGFAKLRRWIGLCRTHNVRYLEIPHLFTQWGAHATPAIYVSTENGTEHRFGWHVEATDPAYRRLLEQLIPALRAVLHEEWDSSRIIYHVSDEPTPEDLDSYRAARAVIEDLLVGAVVVDAISDLSLFESGVVPVPVVANDHAQSFLDAGVPPMWLYYCVAQNRNVANRFIALPSVRSRVLGAQLFRTNAAGFLHWGFNFYNSSLSRGLIDPFADTCASSSFLGGDAFLVYPGPHGQPLESLRHRTIAEAFLDYRALDAVRRAHGSQAAQAICDQDGRLALDSFSYDADHYREALARAARQMDGKP